MSGLVRYGADTVTFLSFTPTTGAQPGKLGTIPMTETPAAVIGCRHRPANERGGRGGGLVAQEFPEVGVDVATQWWHTTCPPHPAALAAKASDLIEVNGQRYQIIGNIRPYKDVAGRFVKVDIVSEQQTIS